MGIHHYFVSVALLCTAREGKEFSRAFAEELDGTINPSEVCRESLAESLYADENREKTVRQGDSNIYLFTGTIQSYRVHAFRTQQESETALTGMVTRARLTP